MADFFCYEQSFLNSSLVSRPLEEGQARRVALGEEAFPLTTPDLAVGVSIWREMIGWLRRSPNFDANEARRKLSELRNSNANTSQRLTCPRIFISHRSVDAPFALSIGKIAKQNGFQVWIDVLDPFLVYLAGQPKSIANAIATAMIVEMALLNCSHVLAVMTINTQGSFWLPYEYGRIKERYLSSSNIAAWFDSSYPNLTPTTPPSPVILPEYLCLGEQLFSRLMIEQWLQSEMRQWGTAASTRCLNTEWPYADPIAIP